MTKCKNCKNPLPFKLVLTSFWAGYKDISCAKCQAQHKFTLKDRLIGGVVVGVSTFITSSMMSYFELEAGSKLLLGLFSMVILFIAFSALSLSFLTFQLNKKQTTHNDVSTPLS